MLKKIKAFFKKCRDNIGYTRCYDFMNTYGLRTYTLTTGICAGASKYGPHNDRCLNCPYFRDIYDNDDWS